LSVKKFLRYIGGTLKIVAAQVVAIIGKKIFDDKAIWIVSEKKTEARDNGFYLFRYIRKSHGEVNAYYVIKKGAMDENKVKAYGNVIYYNSFRHCVYYYAAKIRACSQIHGVRPFEELSRLARIRFYKTNNQRQIYLTHGIAKDYRDSYDFRKIGYDLMICGVKPEYDYYKRTFDYPDSNIALTGICRYDGLRIGGNTEKVILIMPTFREWLRTADSAVPVAPQSDLEMFKNSEFFNFYCDLLSNVDLNKWIKENDYKIVFYLHYTFQPYCSLFENRFGNNDSITVARRADYDVQKLLINSSFLITDYSSVCFDFAYMGKPMVYAQFDKKIYRERHYQEGWFVYERDGLGPIFDDVKSVVLYTIQCGNDGFIMDETFKGRSAKLFSFHDNDNSRRVYEAIIKLDERRMT